MPPASAPHSVPPSFGTPPPPPFGSADAGLPWYRKPWGVALGLLFCFPFGLFALWTHPSWSKQAKQRITAVFAALVLLGGIVNAVSPKDEKPEQVVADTSGDVATTTTERIEETTSTTEPTTTTEATTTTIDLRTLQVAYDAQVAASCETVAQASLAEDDAVLAAGEEAHYDTTWNAHAPVTRFVQDVEYCGHQKREARRSSECENRPEVELLSRDPDKFAGQCFTVVMSITQFDQGTGPCGFRANFDTVAREYSFEYKGDNSIITYPSPCPQLDPLGTDDVIRTRAVVVGGLTYDTTIGGSATAVQFQPIGDPEILQNN